MSNYQELKEKVLRANLQLTEYGLVKFTWGNVSEYDREKRVIAIKPSGVEYANMKVEDIVVVDIDGNKIEGDLKPSSDLDTHLELYRNFSEVNGVVHTHSKWATIWAQSGESIPALGTTHGDYFYGEIPCSRQMRREEIQGDYELETGKVIVETFREKGINPSEIPGVLVYSHGPFAWGKDSLEAVHNITVIEEVAHMAWENRMMNPAILPMQQELLDKHYLRKHGVDAYYGQNLKKDD